MPIFEIPPLETLPQVKDRWTPIYLEHGRLEVDDSSVKWIQADVLVCTIPVASVSTVMLGPGTSVTHAAMLACANSNTMVQWVSQDAVRFYAWGVNTSANNANARNHGKIAFPPHTWGCSARIDYVQDNVSISPTYVGMFRQKSPIYWGVSHFPHIRGDVPTDECCEKSCKDISPTHVGMLVIIANG